MPHFLVEVHLSDADEPELARALRMLEAAQVREGAVARPIVAGISRVDGRLICVIEATTLEAARRTVAGALLPPGRIREIAPVAGSGLPRGRHPRGDVDAGAEAELVQDVVHVRLDRPLGQE